MSEENTLQTPWTEEMLPQEPVPAAAAPYAGFWRRLLAFAVDLFLSGLVPVAVCFPIMFFLTRQSIIAEQTGADVTGYAVAMVITYLVWNLLGAISFWLYFALQEGGKYQATLGKRLLKIKVVSKTGAPLSFAHATGRTFAKILSYLTFYLGFLMTAFSGRKRALHDYIAETYVVKADFQRGELLPYTSSHWGIFTAVAAAFLVLSACFLVYAQRQTANSLQLKTKMALFMLPTIAQQGELAEPFMHSDVTFMQDETGYRAVFQNDAGENYVLYLPDANGAVCCDVSPDKDCQSISVPVCK